MKAALRRLARRLKGRTAAPGPKPARGRPTAPPVIENDTRKPLAALTFVWNEEDYLAKWVDYYGAALGRENLFVVAHGAEPMVQRVAPGCTIHPMPRSRVDALFARRKSDLAAGLVSFLLAEYRTVIVGDVDEYIVIDPALGQSLTEYVQANRHRGQSLKPFNLDMLDSAGAPPLDLGQPFFAQRDLARTRYQFCKPVIVSDRISFAAGFHYASHYPVLASGAYLVHIHFADRALNEKIGALRLASYRENDHLKDAHKRSQGFWARHMQRYEERNSSSADMPIRDLDAALPGIEAALRANVERVARTERNDPGWTMTYGGKDDKFRLRIPARFAGIL